MITSLNLKDFTLQEQIGNGSFGKVFNVKENKTGNIYAAKIAREELEHKSPQDYRDLMREIGILSKANHPSVLKFIGFSPVDFAGNPFPVIITEYVSNGSLYDVLELERNSLSDFKWTDTQKLINIYGIAKAMAYLHSQNVIHRDLKPANILMDEFLCPKIADFGLSKILHTNADSIAASQSTVAVKGTPMYIAPEIWIDCEYTTACDVYSFGVIVYEIVTSLNPFKNQTYYNILTMVTSGKRPPIDDLVPPSYKKLIERCWAQSPESRPTFDEIVKTIKTDEGFITELVEVEGFQDYVDYIDNCPIDFGSKGLMPKIDEYLGHETKTFKKISISELTMKMGIKPASSSSSKKSINHFPSRLFKALPEDCKGLVEEAKSDPEKQFEVGESLIEGSGSFPKNMEIGLKYLEESSNSGSVEAGIYLSQLLMKGELVPQDYEKAKSILESHMSSGDSAVSLLYGKIKIHENDYESAMEQFLASSKAGNAEAMFQCGNLLCKGQGCTKNEKEASRYFMMAEKNGYTISFDHYRHLAEEGDTESMNKCGQMLLTGQGTSINIREALNYFKKSAEKGNIEGMAEYVSMMYDNDSIPVQIDEAARYSKIAAENGNPQGMRLYATCLFNGDGVPVNKSEAARYFKMAADNGIIKAMIKYAFCLDNGEGVPVNKAEAASYYKMAADKGDATAMNNYAFYLFNGEGIPVDKTEAAHYYKMAADKGDAAAMNNYAFYLFNGEGIPVDKTEAARYYKMAADNGIAKAMNNYAFCLDNGEGIPVDKAEAARYYKMAADNGVPKAMYNYAFCLEQGEGIPANKIEAVKYYKMAADNGIPKAMYKYACIMYKGCKGIKANKQEATRYMQMAADQGDPEAISKLNSSCNIF